MNEEWSPNTKLYMFRLSFIRVNKNSQSYYCITSSTWMKCGVIQFLFATPITGYTRRCSNLSLMTSMQLPPHQIISYICHPTDVRAPEASYILFMTIRIICLCADLSVTVAPLLHIVRHTPRPIHHLLYYYALCISLVYQVCMHVWSHKLDTVGEC